MIAIPIHLSLPSPEIPREGLPVPPGEPARSLQGSPGPSVLTVPGLFGDFFGVPGRKIFETFSALRALMLSIFFVFFLTLIQEAFRQTKGRSVHELFARVNSNQRSM